MIIFLHVLAEDLHDTRELGRIVIKLLQKRVVILAIAVLILFILTLVLL